MTKEVVGADGATKFSRGCMERAKCDPESIGEPLCTTSDDGGNMCMKCHYGSVEENNGTKPIFTCQAKCEFN